MDVSVIKSRIEKFEAIKRNLLTLKKEKRHGELKQVNESIARLKGWIKDLEKDPNSPNERSNESDKKIRAKQRIKT